MPERLYYFHLPFEPQELYSREKLSVEMQDPTVPKSNKEKAKLECISPTPHSFFMYTKSEVDKLSNKCSH